MKRIRLLVQLLILPVLMFSGISLHGQGLVEIIAQPPTRVTDCETGLPVGPGYVAELMGAPGGTTDRNLFVRLGAAAPIVNGNLPFSGTRMITFPGSSVSLFATASDAPLTHFGQSAIVTVPIGPLTPPVPITSQFRIPDFQVCPVPEPSTIALAVLGLGTLVVLRRRKV